MKKHSRPYVRATAIAAGAFSLILGLLVGGQSLLTAQDAQRQPSPSDAELRKRLSPLQYRVAKENGTEPAFRNEYWDNKKPGIYVCIISGEPLFSSKDKFDSGTGWPSFTKPLNEAAIEEISDNSHGMVRTEVRSRKGDSHLGHVFDDGPPPTGLRYCMNSAALRFVPADKLAEEGYADLSKEFTKE